MTARARRRLEPERLHIFTAGWQPLTRYYDIDGSVVRHLSRKVFACRECKDRRWAKHLQIQVYYDDYDHIRCADGCYGQRGRRWEE